MGLLMTDIHERNVSIFPPFEIPVALPKPPAAFISPAETVLPNQVPYFFDEYNPNNPSASINPPIGQGYEDDAPLTWAALLDLHPLHRIEDKESIEVSLASIRDQVNVSIDTDGKWAQRWAHWPETNNRAEIQKEEIRRLCWSSMILASLFREFAPYVGQISWDLHITKQENVSEHTKMLPFFRTDIGSIVCFILSWRGD